VAFCCVLVTLAEGSGAGRWISVRGKVAHDADQPWFRVGRMARLPAIAREQRAASEDNVRKLPRLLGAPTAIGALVGGVVNQA
jgi:hypothetical protein